MNSDHSSLNMLKNALEPKGFKFTQLKLGDPAKDFTIIKSSKDNQLIVSSENPVFPFKTCSARLVANDKLKAYDYAKFLEVAIPKTALQREEAISTESLELLNSSDSLIVKPRKGSGSNGITLNVSTVDELQAAIKKAKTFNNEVLIQEQFIGEEIRFVVINGRVEAAILREKPKLVGDGVSTVSQLLAQEDEDRKRIKNSHIRYPLLTEVLLNKDVYNDHTVLDKGEFLELSKATMIKTGASMYNIISKIHPDYIKIAQRIGGSLGSGFIVVDIMVADYLKPAAESCYAFIEFNLAPALTLFYSCRDGRQFPIIEKFLATMIEEVIDGGAA